MTTPSLVTEPVEATDPATDPAGPPATDPAGPPATDPADPPALTPEEQKAADEKAEADKKEAEEKEKANHAPETYEDFKVPEGMEVDKALLDKFLPLAKELDLSQEKAQKLVDFQASIVAEAEERQWNVFEETQKEWVKESESDPEIGGVKLKENLSVAKAAMDAYGSQGLKDLADATGVGNHKEFLRFLIKVGNDTKEDKLRVDGARNIEESRAKRIYDKTPQG